MRSPLSTFLPALALGLVAAGQAPAAEPQLGPVIPHHGPVYAVPADSYNLDPAQSYRVVMDVGKGPDDPAELNRGIESAARFLNMHARNGIPPERLEMAVALHGSGARAALTDAAHQKNFGAPNPNQGLIEELAQAGVQFYLCGQTAGYYGYAPEDLLPGVTLALSAMTVHVRLQQEGYRAILF